MVRESRNGRAHPGRILVVLPNWVGDVVLATPMLRALREHFCDAHITYLLKPYVADLVDAAPWYDELMFWPTRARSRSVRDSQRGFVRTVGALRRGTFDLAVLLTNSFRSALVTAAAGIRVRVGYNRDRRGILLTDRLVAPRVDGVFIPISMVSYYNAMASYLGCRPGSQLELFTNPADEAALDTRLAEQEPPGRGPRVVLNPGAAFGSAKCWLPERFAEVGAALIDQHDARVLIACAPSERPMAREISRRIRSPHACLDEPTLSLRQLKALIRRSDLLITNDTGPRHFGVAFDVPLVTIFGPTAPEWTETGYARERKVLVPVDCGPCMKRICPLDHRCMTRVTAAMVTAAATDLLTARPVEGAVS